MSGSGQEQGGGLLTRKEVAKLVRLSPRTITRYVKEGRFPSPIRFNSIRVRWRRQHIEDYLARLGEAALCTRGERRRYRRTAAERRSALAAR
jgi:predicted DNA-binding transcriptional regulator AlpA